MGAMSRTLDLRTTTPEVARITASDFEHMVRLLLRQQDLQYDLEAMQATARAGLAQLLPLRPHEGAFVEALWDHGEIRPEHLTTDPSIRARISATPLHASWVNQIELLFSSLARRCLRHSSHTSTAHLRSWCGSPQDSLADLRPSWVFTYWANGSRLPFQDLARVSLTFRTSRSHFSRISSAAASPVCSQSRMIWSSFRPLVIHSR